MKLEDARLLLDFSRLMLRIAQAQPDGARIERGEDMALTAANVHRSNGHKRHRRFFLSLSPRKREQYRAQLRQQIYGIRKLIEECEARGEAPDLGDLTIEIFDAASGKPIRAEDAHVLAPAEPDAEPSQETEHERT